MGDRRKPIPVSIQKRLTKFFVSNLPDRCSGMDLAGLVRVQAKIFDIYIARKRDKMGNRFGFVSLLDVKDTCVMERKLSDIRMGEYKLCFNVARFTLEDGEINNRQTEPIKPKIATGMSGGITTGKEVNGGTYVGVRTFKDVMLGRSSESKEEKTIIIQDDFKLPDLGNGKAVIARMKDFKTLKEADEILKGMMEGAGMVQYVGGMVILVSFKFDEEVERFLALSKEKGETFQSVEKRVGQSLSLERIAWLRIQGIPLHLLDNVVINRIGERFGRVVQDGSHDVLDADLSFDYVGVLVSEGKRIQEEVVVQWKGRRYRVWVAEEVADWIPDFVSKDRGSSAKEVPATQNGSPVADKEAPVNRSHVQKSDFPDRPSPPGILESPIFTYTNKEGGMHGQSKIGDHVQKANDILEDVSINSCDSVQEGNANSVHDGSVEESGGNDRSAANQRSFIPGPTFEKDMENGSPLCQDPLIKEGGNHGEFIPGPNFEFENNLGGEGDCITDSHNVTKRKKIKNWVDMGRPSNYSSSGSHKLQGKKARTNDPFALNDLFGLEDDSVSANPVSLSEEGGVEYRRTDDDNSDTEESLDLNAPPGGDNGTLADEHLIGAEAEVNATIALGELLGVRLTNFKGMVRDTILQEGLQWGKA